MRKSKPGRTAIRGHFAETLAAKPRVPQSFPLVDKSEYSGASKLIQAFFVDHRDRMCVCACVCGTADVPQGQ